MEIILKKAQVFQSWRYLLSGAAPLVKSVFINKIYRTPQANNRMSVTVCPATELTGGHKERTQGRSIVETVSPPVRVPCFSVCRMRLAEASQ